MLFLTKSDYEKMLAHCKKGLPNEACGLIGGVVEGEKQYVKKVYLLTNMDESNDAFFHGSERAACGSQRYA